jgi:tellurite resistance protein TehA-like permease
MTAPNWFSSVMGTGIVANAAAAASMPVQWPGLRGTATVIWLLASVWLVTLCGRMAAGWWKDHAAVSDHLRNPAMAHFWGAPPMALLTVATGTLSLGHDWLGLGPALAADWTLWTAGTALGLLTTVAIPYLMMTGRIEAGLPSATWLMPIVPPMVSATAGAKLAAYLPAGQGKLAMLLACYAMFGVSLFATLALLPQIWQRLVRHGVGPAASVPTLWIVLGPLGQSTTAANLLGDDASKVFPAPHGSAAQAFGLLYGVPTWGFAMCWLVLAAAITVRIRPPFSMAWWAFTFPRGDMRNRGERTRRSHRLRILHDRGRHALRAVGDRMGHLRTKYEFTSGLNWNTMAATITARLANCNRTSNTPSGPMAKKIPSARRPITPKSTTMPPMTVSTIRAQF